MHYIYINHQYLLQPISDAPIHTQPHMLTLTCASFVPVYNSVTLHLITDIATISILRAVLLQFHCAHFHSETE